MAALTQNVIQWALPAGDVAQTSVWVEYSGTPTAAQAMARFQTNVIDTIWPSAAGGIKALFYTTVVLNQLETRVIDKPSGIVVTTSKAAYTRAGTGGGSSLPQEVAQVVTLRSGFAGASYRGRMYLPCNSSGALDTNGSCTTAALSTMVTTISNAFIAMNADVTYTSADVVVYSRKLHTTQAVVSIEMGTVFDVQRRRRNAAIEVRTSAAV